MVILRQLLAPRYGRKLLGNENGFSNLENCFHDRRVENCIHVLVQTSRLAHLVRPSSSWRETKLTTFADRCHNIGRS